MIQDSLPQTGKSSMDVFVEDRLSENSTKSFFDPIKKLQLSTFSSMNKVKVCKTKDKVIEVTASTDIFSKIAIIAQTRSIDLQPLFSYPLGAVPLSLAQPDGTLNKTNKAT